MSTILVVEDQHQIRRLLIRLLQTEGYHAVGAANAIEAMAAANRAHPDLVLLDVMIPPMDGLTFLMLLREDPQRRELPVILLTGLSDENTIARARELGVKEYLVKSHFTAQDVLTLVKRHVPPKPVKSPA